ncbi:MAG TPA: RNA-binding protein [Turneriella sp.]|nr:RNA-binding protein [Turneriella sp.]
MNIYVGNLAFATTEQELHQTFAAFGNVQSAKLVTDRETGRAPGFGFVEMENKSEAIKAISALNGSSLNDRDMVVNESRPREDRGNRGRGGYNNRY